MVNIARKSDGRRVFTDAFKREQIGRVWSGELTLAELSRKLGIARSLLQRWKRILPDGNAGMSRARPTTTRELGTEEYIRHLQLVIGRQTVELELLRAELAAHNKKGRRLPGALRP